MKTLLIAIMVMSANFATASDSERLMGSEKLQNALLKVLRTSEAHVASDFGTICTDGICSIYLDNLVCEDYPLDARNHCRFTYLEPQENEEFVNRKVSTQRLDIGPARSIMLANDIMQVLEDNGVESTPTGVFGAGNRYEVEALSCVFNTEKQSNGRVFPANIFCTIEK